MSFKYAIAFKFGLTDEKITSSLLPILLALLGKSAPLMILEKSISLVLLFKDDIST